MYAPYLTDGHATDARTASTFRRLKLLVGSYCAISVLAVVAIVLLRDDGTAVNTAVWTRGTIVAITASLLLAFTVRAERGSHRAYLRLRLTSAIMLVAIVVIVALPGPFPLWMKIEQSLCGLILVGVVTLANSQQLRSLFARKDFGARSVA